MGDRRDPLWFKMPADLITVSLAQYEHALVDLPANSTYITSGQPPEDTHLVGHIEHISAHSVGVSIRNLDVFFLSAHSGIQAVGSDDAFIESESLVTSEWKSVLTVGGKRTAVHGIRIPYQDKEGTKTFHLGVYNRATTAIASGITIEFSWRGDRGES